MPRSLQAFRFAGKLSASLASFAYLRTRDAPCGASLPGGPSGMPAAGPLGLCPLSGAEPRGPPGGAARCARWGPPGPWPSAGPSDPLWGSSGRVSQDGVPKCVRRWPSIHARARPTEGVVGVLGPPFDPSSGGTLRMGPFRTPFWTPLRTPPEIGVSKGVPRRDEGSFFLLDYSQLPRKERYRRYRDIGDIER